MEADENTLAAPAAHACGADSGDMVEIAVETIEKLWNTFGGTVNSKGYKVLDSHIGIIYGDGCTLNNVKQVWEELKKKGFPWSLREYDRQKR